MAEPIHEKLQSLMEVSGPACISLYVPVQKVGADTRQASVVLKQLLRHAAERLQAQGYKPGQIDDMLAPAKALIDHALFWEHQMDGLALFLQHGEMTTWQLPIAVPAQVSVKDRYQIRPLLPLLIQDGQFYVLALGRRATRLLHCNRTESDEITVEGLPESLRQIYDLYEDEKQLQHHTSTGSGTASQSSVYHGGSGSVKETDKKRIEEYFRLIDASLAKLLSDNKTPLVLACVDYLYPIYRQIAHSARLMEQHLSGSPDLSRPDLLRQAAWEIVQPVFEKPKWKAWQTCQNLQGTARVVSDIRLIFSTLSHGRVGSLFIKNGINLPGSYDVSKGIVYKADPASENIADADDLLDLAARMTLQSSGQVFIMDPADMPESVDYLAMLRY